MSQEQNTLELIRNAATQYGRCCDLYQDGLGTFHCHEDGQRTFAMLRDVQQILGVDKALVETMDDDRQAARKRAALNNAAPDLLEALRGMSFWIEQGKFDALPMEAIRSLHSAKTAAAAAIAKATGAA